MSSPLPINVFFSFFFSFPTPGLTRLSIWSSLFLLFPVSLTLSVSLSPYFTLFLSKYSLCVPFALSSSHARLQNIEIPQDSVLGKHSFYAYVLWDFIQLHLQRMPKILDSEPTTLLSRSKKYLKLDMSIIGLLSSMSHILSFNYFFIQLVAAAYI